MYPLACGLQPVQARKTVGFQNGTHQDETLCVSSFEGRLLSAFGSAPQSKSVTYRIAPYLLGDRHLRIENPGNYTVRYMSLLLGAYKYAESATVKLPISTCS